MSKFSLNFFSRVHNKFFRTSLLVKKSGKNYHGSNGIWFVQLREKKRAEFVRLKMSKMRT